MTRSKELFVHPFVMLVCTILIGMQINGCSNSESDVAPSSSPPEEDAHVVEIPEEYQKGHSVYEQQCAMCHHEGEGGAPRVGSEKQWAKRISKGKDILAKNAFEGFEGEWGTMPPQGDDLSMEDISAAVDYIVYESTNQAEDNE